MVSARSPTMRQQVQSWRSGDEVGNRFAQPFAAEIAAASRRGEHAARFAARQRCAAPPGHASAGSRARVRSVRVRLIVRRSRNVSAVASMGLVA